MPIFENCDERRTPSEQMWCHMEAAKENLYQAKCLTRSKARQEALDVLITDINKAIHKFLR